MVMGLYWAVRWTLWRREKAYSLSSALLPEVFQGNSGQALGPFGGMFRVSIGQANSDQMPENQFTCVCSFSLLTSCTCHSCSPMQACPRTAGGPGVRRTWQVFWLSWLAEPFISSAHNTVQVVT